jgi:serine/threonine protein kinase
LEKKAACGRTGAGGLALREWHQSTVHGTRVLVSRYHQCRNPPPGDIRRANVRAYALLRHPNIVTLLGITPTGELVTEICEGDLAPIHSCDGGAGGGTLRHCNSQQNQKARRVLSLSQTLRYARDIARALAWAHSMSVIHRDVKPSHWLVVGEQAKLGGWIFAEVQDGPAHPRPDNRFHGTPLYMAPELWKQEAFDDKKADVYSFGLSLWEVFNNKLAFGDWNHLCSFREALVEKDLRPELSDKAPTTVNRLVASCWAHDPDDRPTMVEVVDSLTNIIDAVSLLEGAGNQ